jgi:hypothetical protein
MPHKDQATLAAPTSERAPLGRYGGVGLMTGVIGFLVYWIAYFAQPADIQAQMAHAYMYGWTFWATLTLGCLAMTFLHHAVRGSWGLAVLRILEAGGSATSFLVVFLAYLPILIIPSAIQSVYPWTHPGNDPVLLNRLPLYNPTAFVIRQVILFAIWIAFAAALRRSSVRQDTNKDSKEAQWRTNWSAPGLVVTALTGTMAATDWVMSMDPHWYSTMFGPIIIICGALGALSFAVYLVCLNRDKAPFNQIMSPNLTKDFGNMLLTITMLWAYFNFSQFLIIWNGNLPQTARYYAMRSPHFFNVLGFVLIVGCFVLPFCALLAPRTKRFPENIAKVALWIFAMRFLDIYYIVVPMYSKTMVPTWEILSVLAVGGFWLAAYAHGVAEPNLYPVHDMRLMEGPHEHGA